MSENDVENKKKPKDKKAKCIGKDKVRIRRNAIVTNIMNNPNKKLDLDALAEEHQVNVRTIHRDMASPEVINAVDETIENHCDGILIHHAWRNITNRIINNKDVDLSVWLVNHRAKQANTDRLFDQFQREFAQELAATMAMDMKDFDAQEMVSFNVAKPDIEFSEN